METISPHTTSKERMNKLLSSLLAVGTASQIMSADQLGYKDTPMIPGTRWHVHDGDRPQPRIVEPGEKFSQKASPPGDAVVLFDGTDFSKWQSGQGGEVKWKIEDD